MGRLVRVIAVVGLAVLAASGAALAQGGKTREAQIDEIFAPWNKPDSAGCGVETIENGRVSFVRGYGMADIENGIPITPSSVFEIASTSKQFTGMAILLLIQDGKLSLDDDVRKYVPELPRFGAPILVRDLVYHTSGLQDTYYLLDLAGWRGDDEIHESDVLDMVRRMTVLNHPTGREFAYNNAGYSLMALLVQRVSGKSLRQFAQERIFAPLGMTHSLFRDDHTLIVKNRTRAYVPNGNGGFQLGMGNTSAVGPNGVNTSLEDFALWDANFDSGKVAGKKGMELFTASGRLRDGTPVRYGFGIRVDTYKGLPMWWHSGAGYGQRTTYLRFPTQHFSVVLLCNGSDINMDVLARQVADVYLHDRYPASAERAAAGEARLVAVPQAELATATGLYFSPVNGLLRRVVLENGKLFYRRPNGTGVELMPMGNGRFALVGGPGAVLTVKSGPHKRLTLDNGTGQTADFEPVEDKSYVPAELQAFAGRYYSANIGAEYSIEAASDHLILRRRKAPDQVLRPAFKDAFGGEDGVLRFRRDARGRVHGFTLINGERGVRSLPFERRTPRGPWLD